MNRGEMIEGLKAAPECLTLGVQGRGQILETQFHGIKLAAAASSGKLILLTRRVTQRFDVQDSGRLRLGWRDKLKPAVRRFSISCLPPLVVFVCPLTVMLLSLQDTILGVILGGW